MFNWSLPISALSCQKQNYNVSCNFALYTNATNLTDAQKLPPNNDITGPGVCYVSVMLLCAI